MMITEDEVEQEFHFGSINEIHLKNNQGTKFLRLASVTPQRIHYFNRNRMILSAMGIVFRKQWNGGPNDMEFAWWTDKPAHLQIKEEIALAGSKAVSSDFAVPMGGGISLRPYQAAGVDYMRSRKGFLLADEMGLGKEQPVSMPVLTPTGWRPIGDLSVNSEIVGSDGSTRLVTGVFPQGVKRAFMVYFSDGSNVECGAEHLWAVRNTNGTSRGDPFRILNTSQIQKRIHEKWEIPLMEAAQFRSAPLPIPPYLLGVLIGDGCLVSSGINFVPGDEMVPAEVQKVIPDWLEIRRGSDHGTSTRYSVAMKNRLRVHPYKMHLKEWGLDVLGHLKFIPKEYLFSSIEDRKEILRGLMDTDGSCNGCRLRYCTTSARLSDDVAHLVRSLGGLASISTFLPKRSNEIPVHTVCFSGIGNPFTNRKVSEPRSKRRRVIIRIEPMGLVDQVCISVSHPNRLYVTRDFIVTHNTLQIVGVINCNPKMDRVLIICPKAVRTVWWRELSRGLVRKRSIAFAEGGTWPTSDIVVLHYDVAHKFEAQMTGLYWDLTVIDEGHYLRNKKTRRARVILGGRADTEKKLAHCSGVQSRVKCITTGTPLANSPMDLFPYLRWADKDHWGTYTDFQRDYVYDPGGHHRLNKRLMEWGMLRRLKKDVLKELPPKIRQMLVIDAHTPDQLAVISHDQELVQRFRTKMTTEMSEDDFMKDVDANVLKILKLPAPELSKMRQMTAKALFPDAVIQAREILESKEKLVIYAHHRESILALREEFQDMGAVHWMGGMDGSKLPQHITTFQRDSKCRVFVASILATGTGVDGLQEACSTCLFTEGDWLSVTMDQAEDRLHRFGQLSTVESYHMALAGSVMIRILQLSMQKRRIADRVIDGSVAPAPIASIIAQPTARYKETPLFGRRPGKGFGQGVLPGLFR